MTLKKIPLLIVFLSILFIPVADLTYPNHEQLDIESRKANHNDTSRNAEGDTFSIVAYDKTTGQVGGAGCSCVSISGGIDFLSDLITDGTTNPDNIVGAIHSQASYNETYQNFARNRMLAGDTPQEIINATVAADGGSANRQYGVVGVDNPGAAGFTGSSNGNFANDIQVDNAEFTISIQGNILDASSNGGRNDILFDMRDAFLNAEGSLADRLMAALQGAKRVGGDSRCESRGNSGRTAFVQVLSPGETSPSLFYTTGNAVADLIEPIDILQCIYDNGQTSPICRKTVNTFPYSMDFETKSWEQETATCNTNSSWIRSRFTSPSSNTGPSGANQGDLYTHIEASDIGGQGTAPRNAILGSPCFELPSNNSIEMTFDYHMLGANMGTLSIEVSDDAGSTWDNVWSLSGDQGSNWINDESIDLSIYAGNTVKIRVNALMGNGFASDMAIDDIKITTTELVDCTGPIKTWNGNSWSPAGTPDGTNPVILTGNYNTTTHGNLNSCSLEINSGATLIVNGGHYAQANYDITVNTGAVLFIEHEGSVVQQDNDAVTINNGTISVEKITPNLDERDFMILGSPVSGETRNGVYGTSVMVRNHITGNFVPNEDVENDFPLAENFADDNGDNWVNYTGTINAGEGYLVRPQTTPTGTGSFTLDYTQGTLNNGIVTFDLLFNTEANDSPNMLSNPYPSAIDADAFLDANPTIQTLYFWEHLTAPNPSYPGYNPNNYNMSDISMYNEMGGSAAGNDPGTSTRPNGYIASGQGFGVKTNAAGTATFNNSMRVNDNNDTYRRTSFESDRIWLGVYNEKWEMGSSILVGFSDASTNGFDAKYDSKRLATPVSLYSEMPSGEQLAIQGLAPLENETQVSLGFDTQIDEETTYRISINDIEGINIEDTTVYLIDNKNNNVTNLSETDYEFTTVKGQFNSRFTLQFKSSIVLDVTDILSNVTIFPNPASHTLNIVSPNAYLENISVYDLLGRRINKKVGPKNNNYQLKLSQLNTGIYFVKIDTEVGTVTKKLIKK